MSSSKAKNVNICPVSRSVTFTAYLSMTPLMWMRGGRDHVRNIDLEPSETPVRDCGGADGAVGLCSVRSRGSSYLVTGRGS